MIREIGNLRVSKLSCDGLGNFALLTDEPNNNLYTMNYSSPRSSLKKIEIESETGASSTQFTVIDVSAAVGRLEAVDSQGSLYHMEVSERALWKTRIH